MPGKFEVYKDKSGKHRFRLKAANGQNILASEGYNSKASCMNGIDSVRKNSKFPARFEERTSASGTHSFRLKSSNGQVIGVSQNYKSRSGCSNGITSVVTCAADAKVVEA